MTHTLLCDVGGTHIRLALQEKGQKDFSKPEKFKTDPFKTFEDSVKSFLNNQNISLKDISALKIASAVRPQNGIVQFDNSYKSTAWRIDPAQIESSLGILRKNTHITMDTQAQFIGLNTLTESDQIPVKTAKTQPDGEGTLLISLGTGLGHAYQANQASSPIATHGGHMPPLANTSEQAEALAFIHNQKGTQLIYEDVVSGRGFYNLYAYSGHSLSIAPKADDIYSLEPLIQDLKYSTELKKTARLFAEFLGLYIHQCAAYTHCFGQCYLIGGLLRKLQALDLLHQTAINAQLSLDMVQSVYNQFETLRVSLVTREHLTLHGLTAID